RAALSLHRAGNLPTGGAATAPDGGEPLCGLQQGPAGSGAMNACAEPILRVTDVVKNVDIGVPLERSKLVIHAVDGISLEVYEGETLAVVGESGWGKSTLGRLIMRLIEPTSGSIELQGEELTAKHGRALLPYRRKLQMI